MTSNIHVIITMLTRASAADGAGPSAPEQSADYKARHQSFLVNQMKSLNMAGEISRHLKR